MVDWNKLRIYIIIPRAGARKNKDMYKYWIKESHKVRKTETLSPPKKQQKWQKILKSTFAKL
jgi:hypothetical protein